jgi:penicillin-binding protein 1B
MILPGRRRRILIVAACIAGAVVIAAVLYLGWLNWRMSEAIVAAPWRHPIEIVSGVRGADSEPVARLYGDDWRVTEPVRIEELPAYVPNAFLAAEDVRFYHHPGVDPFGLARAAAANVRGRGIAQGGSTITQQLIKQKLFSNARTMRRKIPEMALAVILTARMSKKDVLEGYLNEVYLGEYGGAPIYGIDEASRVFFDKPPVKLTPAEAALIAGIVRAPNRDNPIKRPDEARGRRDAILAVMHGEEWLTNEQYEHARSREVRIEEGTLPDAPYGHYLSALRTELAAHGSRIPRSGIRIVAHLDPEMQESAERVARSGTAALRRRTRHLAGRDDLQVAILSADPKSGGVRALVGSRDFAIDAYDRTRRMRRQPGSALKPFVYAAALETRDFTPVTSLSDAPMRVKLGRNDYWTPHNYDERFRGPVALRVALEQSLNVPTVRLAEDVGLKKIAGKLRSFGFEEEFERVPSLPLGVTEVSLRELVAAYSAFPSLGHVPELHLISEVRDRRGRTVYRREPRRERALDAPVAWLTHDLLRGVVLRGTASRLTDEGLEHVAGKTGTTTDYRDAWFVGYAPDLVTGLWVGCDGGAPLRLSAAEAAVPLWAAYMDRVKTSRAEIAPPEGIVFRRVDPTNGRLWRAGCAGPVREAFVEGTEPETDCRAGGRTLLARARGNPEPPEISAETWRRWSSEPIVRRRNTRARTGDDAPRLAGRGGIPDLEDEGERRRPPRRVSRPSRADHERARERAARQAEEWRKDEEKRFERLRKEQEKRHERVHREEEKRRDERGKDREKRGGGDREKRDKEKKEKRDKDRD